MRSSARLTAWLVVALEMQGKYPEAFEWGMKVEEKLFRILTTESFRLFGLLIKDPDGRDCCLSRLDDLRTVEPKDLYFQGAIDHAKVGKKNKAFECLEKSYQTREAWMSLLKVEPGLDSVRDDPRFDELVKRVGF